MPFSCEMSGYSYECVMPCVGTDFIWNEEGGRERERRVKEREGGEREKERKSEMGGGEEEW